MSDFVTATVTVTNTRIYLPCIDANKLYDAISNCLGGAANTAESVHENHVDWLIQRLVMGNHGQKSTKSRSELLLRYPVVQKSGAWPGSLWPRAYTDRISRQCAHLSAKEATKPRG